MKQYKLMHTFGNVIHVGSKEECELILHSFIKYGISSHKFDIEEV